MTALVLGMMRIFHHVVVSFRVWVEVRCSGSYQVVEILTMGLTMIVEFSETVRIQARYSRRSGSCFVVWRWRGEVMTDICSQFQSHLCVAEVDPSGEVVSGSQAINKIDINGLLTKYNEGKGGRGTYSIRIPISHSCNHTPTCSCTPCIRPFD